MARSSLFRGILFALVAGSLTPPLLYALGIHWGLAVGAVFAVAAHLLFSASELRRGTQAAGLSLLLGVPVLVLVRNTDLVLALSAVNLALCRSVLLYPRSFARALLLELVFLGAGVACAALWWDSALLGWCAAVWSFWLVQAAFALTTSTQKPHQDVPIDPFERARALAEGVLAGRH